jgi:hypothetical protein
MIAVLWQFDVKKGLESDFEEFSRRERRMDQS